VAINFDLVDEDGGLVETGAILELADLPVDSSYHYLRLIDPYGDTTFGPRQMVAVVPELERWSLERPTKAVLKLLELSRACARGRKYIKLIGD
jgi:hypothetical protein